MTERLEKQAELDRAIVNALISATPETWQSFAMDVERQHDGKYESMLICITNPADRVGTTCPTDEIYETLFEQLNFCREQGGVWQKLRFEVALNDAGDWTYHIDFAY